MILETFRLLCVMSLKQLNHCGSSSIFAYMTKILVNALKWLKALSYEWKNIVILLHSPLTYTHIHFGSFGNVGDSESELACFDGFC